MKEAEKEAEIKAFPTQVHEYDGQGNILQYQEEGMSLRDYFAAKHLQGVSADREMWISCCRDSKTPNPIEGVAEYCYEMADAMLKARNKILENKH